MPAAPLESPGASLPPRRGHPRATLKHGGLRLSFPDSAITSLHDDVARRHAASGPRAAFPYTLDSIPVASGHGPEDPPVSRPRRVEVEELDDCRKRDAGRELRVARVWVRAPYFSRLTLSVVI